MKLETKRLILRELTKKDTMDICNNVNNLQVTRYLLVVPHPYKKSDAEKWINYCIEKSKEKPRENYELGIELKDEKRIIGAIALTKIDRFQGTAEIGYWLGEKYWRQGIMSEAARELIDFTFKKLKLRRLEAPIFKENKASQGLVKSLGFRYEGTKRKAAKAKSTGKIHDETLYGLLKEDYKKKRKNEK